MLLSYAELANTDGEWGSNDTHVMDWVWPDNTDKGCPR